MTREVVVSTLASHGAWRFWIYLVESTHAADFQPFVLAARMPIIKFRIFFTCCLCEAQKLEISLHKLNSYGNAIRCSSQPRDGITPFDEHTCFHFINRKNENSFRGPVTKILCKAKLEIDGFWDFSTENFFNAQLESVTGVVNDMSGDEWETHGFELQSLLHETQTQLLLRRSRRELSRAQSNIASNWTAFKCSSTDAFSAGNLSRPQVSTVT